MNRTKQKDATFPVASPPELVYIRASSDDKYPAELILSTSASTVAFQLRDSQIIQIAQDAVGFALNIARR